jgi:hypothetical protein
MASSTQTSAPLKRQAPQNIDMRKLRRTEGGQDDQPRGSQEAQPFRFFDVPAELRNVVYAYMVEGQTAYIYFDGYVTDISSYQFVSEQFTNEYSAILAHCAGAIKVEVMDFDFRSVVTFINRLSAAELDNFASVTKPSSKIFRISLLLCRMRESEFADGYLLHRWLNHAGHATKKSTRLDFDYSAHRSSEPGYSSTFAKWYRVVDDFIEVARD